MFVSYLCGTLSTYHIDVHLLFKAQMPFCISWFKILKSLLTSDFFFFKIHSLFGWQFILSEHFWPAWVGHCTIFLRLHTLQLCMVIPVFKCTVYTIIDWEDVKTFHCLYNPMLLFFSQSIKKIVLIFINK